MENVGQRATSSGAGSTGSESTPEARAQARIEALRGILPASVPDGAWAAAQGQLAGMLGALDTLQRDLPALGEPPGRPGQIETREPTSGAGR